MGEVLIVDGNNLLYASACGPPLKAHDGFPSNGIYFFLQSLQSAMIDFNAKRVFVAWDNGRSKERLRLYPQYKANRNKPKAPQQQSQFETYLLSDPVVKKALRYLGVDQAEGQDVEADDIIAILAKACQNRGEHSTLISSDKDFLQLVSPLVSVYCSIEKKNGMDRLITPENMVKNYGLPPDRWLEYRALTGDTGDNLPGVKGIGDKTAEALLKAFPNVDAFIANPRPLTRQKKELLLKDAAKQQEFKTFKQMIDLTRICCQDLATIKITQEPPDFEAFVELCDRYDFNSIITDADVWTLPFARLEKTCVKE